MHTLLKSHSIAPAKDYLSFNSECGKDRISANLRRKLLFRHYCNFDWNEGGAAGPIKFLDRDSIEYALCQAAHHDRNEERMARLCLDRGMALIDKNDGGIYQFASGPDWSRCRYSKSVAAQAGSLRLYSLAYALLGEHAYLVTARRIFSYIRRELLTDAGVFRPVLIPAMVDAMPHRESLFYKIRDNGWLLEALGAYYEFCGDRAALDTSTTVMDTLLSGEHRVIDTLLNDAEGRFELMDKLSMARACLQTYRTSAQHSLLEKCELRAKDIASEHTHPAGGFSARAFHGNTGKADRQLDENICAARFFNLLHHNAGDVKYLELARHGLRYLARPEVALARPEESGILLLEEELTTTPVKVTILGESADTKANKLHQQALRTFGWYKVIHRQ